MFLFSCIILFCSIFLVEFCLGCCLCVCVCVCVRVRVRVCVHAVYEDTN